MPVIAACAILAGMGWAAHCFYPAGRRPHRVWERDRHGAGGSAVGHPLAALPRPAPAAVWPTGAGVPPDLADPGLQAQVVGWAQRDPAAALRWLAALPGGSDRTRLIAAVGLALAPDDLDAAKQLVEALPRGGDRRSLVAGVTRIWVQRDPAAAAVWLAPLPEGLERDQALSIVAEAWAKADPAAAADWLDRLPRGESRDRAEAAFQGVAVR